MSRYKSRLPSWRMLFAAGLFLVGVALSATLALAALPADPFAGNPAYTAAAPAPPPPPAVAAAAPLSGCWTVETTANVGTGGNYLLGAAQVTTSDIWAVGYYTDTTGGFYALTEHGVNHSWSVVPIPALSGHNSYFAGATALAANNVWAVGSVLSASLTTAPPHLNAGAWADGRAYSRPSLLHGPPVSPQDSYHDLFEHWNGSAWTRVPGAGTTVFDEILAIGAVSANDIWAVGDATTMTRTENLIEHYNGTAWQVVPSPDVGVYANYLQAIAVVATNDVWAAGIYKTASAVKQNLVEHWNGSAWSVVPVPNSGSGDNALFGLAARSGPVAAPGSPNTPDVLHVTGNIRVGNPPVDHWVVLESTDQGSTWTNTYNSTNAPGLATAIACFSNYCTVVGGIDTTLGIRPLALICDDTTSSCTDVSPPDPGHDSTFNGCILNSPNEAEAFGYELNHPAVANPGPPGASAPDVGQAQTLVMRFDNPCGGPTPSPTPPTGPTATPGGPTVTPAPTQTPGGPTATPGPCTLTFSDVPPSSPFYTYIECLACRGIISGYGDGTFRPGANVTRGQLAKIIANAAAFADTIPAGRQTFADVPASNGFWLFIERVYAHGAISGYTCGGPGEPCPGLYYRPGANVTRGQLAKIDANARGYADPIPPTRQTFADVPPANPFWLFIERVALHGVVSGYSCGGGGEPCPGTYYRAAGNVTRGQTAKIMVNTFFPGCPPQRR